MRMNMKSNQMIKLSARSLGQKSRSGAAIAALVTGMLAMTGCEILSICTFPSDRLATASTLPMGKFVILKSDIEEDARAIEVVADGSGYRIEGQWNLGGSKGEYLELFELDGFLGFNSRPAIPSQDEMELVPERQREILKDFLSNGIHPWQFGAVEVYGDAFMVLVPFLMVDEVAMFIKQNDVQIIDGDISHSAAYQIAMEQERAKKKANAGVLQKRLGLDDLSSPANQILTVTPEQLEEFTGEFLRRDLLLPLVYLPVSMSDAIQGLEEVELVEVLREHYKPLADRYEHVMAAFEAREELEDEEG